LIKLAVAGSPIGHSLSPLLHSTAYEILGVKADFGSNEIKEQDFGNFYYQCSQDEIFSFSQWFVTCIWKQCTRIGRDLCSQVQHRMDSTR
jgi:hypothetical protein